MQSNFQSEMFLSNFIDMMKNFTGGWCGSTLAHCTCSGCIDYNQEPLPKPYLSEDPEEVLVSKGYSAIILDEYVIDANFTLEHCGCQRYLKGIVIPFVEIQVLR